MVPTFETRAIEALKAKGYRITSARISVLRTLEESAEPLSAQRIFDKMQLANIRIDVVSVYRVLSVLASVHLVHHVGVVDGYVACRMADEHSPDLPAARAPDPAHRRASGREPQDQSQL